MGDIAKLCVVVPHHLDVQVCYPEQGRSHVHCLRDVEIAWMHLRLFGGMLLRLPILLVRKLPGVGGR